MNEILKFAIAELLTQRARVLNDLSELDAHSMNYSMKEMNLKNLIFDIDNQVNNLMNRVFN